MRAGSPAHCRLIDYLTRLLAGQAGPTRAPGGPRALVPTATRATRSPRALSALPPPTPARPSLADVTLPPRLCPVGSVERGSTRWGLMSRRRFVPLSPRAGRLRGGGPHGRVLTTPHFPARGRLPPCCVLTWQTQRGEAPEDSKRHQAAREGPSHRTSSNPERPPRPHLPKPLRRGEGSRFQLLRFGGTQILSPCGTPVTAHGDCRLDDA